MRASRLLSILILLQLRTRLTAQALADEFEVSERTIYRDIDALSAAGVPVYGDRGPGGGFQLLDGYRTRLTGLASDEAEAMLMIGLPESAAALGIGNAAKSARNKLMAALPGQSGSDAGRIAARFHLDTTDWYRSVRPTPHLSRIARAVLDARALRMTYQSWTAERDWSVHPWGLVQKAGNWYLVAHGHGKPRIFNVADIVAVEIGDAPAKPPPDGFALASWWREETAAFETRLRPHVATLRATALGCERLAKLGSWAAEAVAVGEREGDRLLVRLAYENDEQAALMLLGIGPEVEVVEPAAVRESVRDLARRMAS